MPTRTLPGKYIEMETERLLIEHLNYESKHFYLKIEVSKGMELGIWNSEEVQSSPFFQGIKIT